jgi:5,10-methylene-tetrahydrofolate dehydrogenase/methenyl tetrahydrofolate cyclohydrolase
MVNIVVLPQVLHNIQSINEDARVHGLIVQLPLDSIRPIDSGRVTDAVSPHKDVDGWVLRGPGPGPNEPVGPHRVTI